MRHTFSDEPNARIESDGQTAVRSSIEVDLDGSVVDVDVAVLIQHNYVGDLVIVLEAPSGQFVVLADQVRGSARNYNRTVFDDKAAQWIADAPADAFGVYRPVEPLAALNGLDASGTWTLHVLDMADRDGGTFFAWALSAEVAAPVARQFEITVDFDGGLTARQRDAFADAAHRWQQVIVAPLMEMRADSQRTTTGVVISARGVAIDGPRGTLGQAGPTHLRPGSGLPYLGIMQFDLADLATMELDGSLGSVITHEMGHVLGIGTIWSPLIANVDGPDPRYLGPAANQRWQDAGGADGVPIANTGGPGTRGGHWREQVLVDELMTGFLSGSAQPLSEITIGCLDDLGYEVDYGAADEYQVPGPGHPALVGLDSSAGRRCLSCNTGRFPDPIVGPIEDIV